MSKEYLAASTRVRPSIHSLEVLHRFERLLVMLIQNVGKVDRMIRLTIAVVMLYLGAFVYPGSTLGITLATLALIPLMTGTLGFCPFYRLVKFSTCTVRRHS